jgi:hypothetical protein
MEKELLVVLLVLERLGLGKDIFYFFGVGI